MKKIFLLIVSISLIISCASTKKAWSKFKPNEYAYVHTNGIDPEPRLIKHNINYFCKKVSYSSDNLTKACYVEKSLSKKIHEFNNALLKTPKALLIDSRFGEVSIIALDLFFYRTSKQKPHNK